ncbi:hypothetical protein LFB98_004855 [Salmonella enterica]|nr:hypothetical protein [Salmonella enterica]
MERFAKLFETHGHQILVKKGENTNGDFALCVSTMFNGEEMSLNMGFGDNEDKMNHALDLFTQEQADAFGKVFEGKTNAFEALESLTDTGEIKK